MRVKLQEFHHYMFRPGDLEHQAKDAFFNGLHPEYQLMVVHKQDDPRVNITQLLAAIRECEENQENNWHNHHAEDAKVYLPSTTRNNNKNYCNHHQNIHTLHFHTLPHNMNQDRNCYHQDDSPTLPIPVVHADPDVHIQVNNDYLSPYVNYYNLTTWIRYIQS